MSREIRGNKIKFSCIQNVLKVNYSDNILTKYDNQAHPNAETKITITINKIIITITNNIFSTLWNLNLSLYSFKGTCQHKLCY